MSADTAKPTPLDLDACRKLAAEERAVADKTTPGPYVVRGELGDMVTIYHVDRGRHFVIAEVRSWDRQRENAEAMARSRTAVPALADAVLTLADEVERLRRLDDSRGMGQLMRALDGEPEAIVGQPVSWIAHALIERLRADVAMLRAVVEALPTCHAEPERGSPAAEAHPPRQATKREAMGPGIYCDEHAPRGARDLPHAAALRALLAKGGGR